MHVTGILSNARLKCYATASRPATAFTHKESFSSRGDIYTPVSHSCTCTCGRHNGLRKTEQNPVGVAPEQFAFIAVHAYPYGKYDNNYYKTKK